MAKTIASMVAELSLNSAKFTSGLNEVNRKLSSWEKNVINMGKSIGAAFGAYLTVDMFRGFIDAAAEAETIANKLRFALEMQGYSWEQAKIATDDFANSIQNTSRFSDEQARQSLQQMTLYTKEYTKAEQGARLAMDMSARTGMDLESTTQYVGMAMAGNVERLGRFIPQLRNLDNALGKNATQADKAAYSLRVMQELFGGSAANDLNTYAGQLSQFKNRWDDLKESLGNLLLGPATGILKWLTDVTNKVQGFVSLFSKPKNEIEAMRKELFKLEDELANLLEYGGGKTGEEKGFIDTLFPGRLKRIDDIKNKIDALKASLKGLTDAAKTTLAGQGEKDTFAPDQGKLESLANQRTSFERSLLQDLIKVQETGLQQELMLLRVEYDEKMAMATKIGADVNKVTEWYLAKREEAYNKFKEAIPEWKEFTGDILESDNTVKEFITTLDRFTQEPISITLEEWEKRLESNREEWQGFTGDIQEADNAIQEFVTTMEGTFTKVDFEKRLEEAEKSIQPLKDFANQLGDTWASVFSNMVDGTESFSDTVKKSFKSLADSVIHQIMRMMINWALWGSMSGAPQKGLGTGLIGMLAGLLPKNQAGGVFNTPTAGIIGEAGPEAVIPLKGGKIPIEGNTGGGGTTIVYISAMDAKSVNDYFRRNPGPILNVLSRDQRRRGATA